MNIFHPYHSELPKELAPYHVWVPDCGHSIMCVLTQFIDEAKVGKISDYQLPVPVKYVLQKGYTVHPNCIEVNVPYNKELGLYIEGDYEEW